jgi:glycosyltransferase involved in cell wall biosynthesis
LRIGLYSPFFGDEMGGGEKYFGVAAEAIRDGFPNHQLDIISPIPVDVRRYEEMLGLDLTGINIRVGDLRAPRSSSLVHRVPVLRRYADLRASARAIAWTRDYDVFIPMVYVMPTYSLARRGVILCQFPYKMPEARPVMPGWPPGLYRTYTAPYHRLQRRWLRTEAESFQLVICQSGYVRHWVRRYWDRDSQIVHPPIDVPAEEPDFARKEPAILSVGRFFDTGHAKRHDVMVQAFRRLSHGPLPGWKLHLVGSLNKARWDDVDYLRRIEQLAAGLPVEIHVDASLDELRDLYRRASIYWHAAGFGVDETQRPIDLEHFGMTTAEAMGYGAVPLAIARGGQLEVVREGEDGFLWSDIEDLVQLTVRVAEDEGLRARLGAAARKASQRFSRPEFKRQMVEAVSPIIKELECETSRAA